MDKKRIMRHTAIYCINETTAKDEDIEKLIEYAFYRVYKEGVYELKKLCVGKQKSDILTELAMLLEAETEMRLI